MNSRAFFCKDYICQTHLLLSIMKKSFFNILFILITIPSFAQNGYWQQHVDYKMDVKMDVKKYQYKGTQELIYTNNSPDTLKRVFYHLYPNAFQPGSEMDARVQSIADPDSRMVTKIKSAEGKEIKESRIAKLKSDEIGFLKISNFKQDGVLATAKEIGTILEVYLPQPLLPGKATIFTLDFDGQVPAQIRRSGRKNKEGVELSMSQWYPKIAEFDFEGWHADPYIGREFHGVWGNFDVKITIDKEYILGGTGYLQNKNEIGYNYEDPGIVIPKRKQKTLTWHFIAPNVHDFTWAADKDYIHDVIPTDFGTTLHFLYKNNQKIIPVWKQAEPKTVELMKYYNQIVGKYPYEQYSVIQGGDGGMEYAMCTLVLGEGKLDGFVGLIAHEMGHSWFQHILASNESKHYWMDEGFTTFIEDLGMNELAVSKKKNPFNSSYENYLYMVNSGIEQPLSTHGDRFDLNVTYSICAYSKGELFLSQLIYLIGKENTMKTLKRFYNDFKFKHPSPNDIKRTAERISGAELDWYLTDWTETTNTIDYGIKTITDNEKTTVILLERIGNTPMPIDVLVEYMDGSKESFYIPLRMMHFEKENPSPEIKRTVLNDWAWAYNTYNFSIEKPKNSIKKITLDPSNLMADVQKENNFFENK